MVIDTRAGRILHSAETDDDLKSRHPYKSGWRKRSSHGAVRICRTKVGSRQLDDDTLASCQKWLTAHSAEELDSVLRVLGEMASEEAVGSWAMTRLSPCSPSQPRIIYDCCQQFAQVTNPPIDPAARSASCRWLPASARNERLLRSRRAHRLKLQIADPAVLRF